MYFTVSVSLVSALDFIVIDIFYCCEMTIPVFTMPRGHYKKLFLRLKGDSHIPYPPPKGFLRICLP